MLLKLQKSTSSTRALYGIPRQEEWISKYCSDSGEAQSHREKNLVNDILRLRRYLDAPISPMTLPMDQDTEIIVTDSTYEALKLTEWAWERKYMDIFALSVFNERIY